MSHPHWLHLTLSGVAAHVILQAVYNTFECVVLYWLYVVTGKAPRVTEARRTNEGFAWERSGVPGRLPTRRCAADCWEDEEVERPVEWHKRQGSETKGKDFLANILFIHLWSGVTTGRHLYVILCLQGQMNIWMDGWMSPSSSVLLLHNLKLNNDKTFHAWLVPVQTLHLQNTETKTETVNISHKQNIKQCQPQFYWDCSPVLQESWYCYHPLGWT